MLGFLVSLPPGIDFHGCDLAPPEGFLEVLRAPGIAGRSSGHLHPPAAPPPTRTTDNFLTHSFLYSRRESAIDTVPDRAIASEDCNAKADLPEKIAVQEIFLGNALRFGGGVGAGGP